MRGHAQLMSSARTGLGRDDWQTPDVILKPARELFGGQIELDPCAPTTNNVGARTFFYGGEIGADGLEERWRDHAGNVFVNWPYSKSRTWAAKCAQEAAEGDGLIEIVGLCAARTDTRFWHESITTAQAVCFVRGRLKFVGATAGAPFPSAIPYWGDRYRAFERIFRHLGQVVRL